jgi:5-methyltetrahydropteroyltriglutamate--homocysteine methyltransferase
VKAGIAAAGASVDDFFFPLLSPGWLAHFLWNEYYQTEEEYCYALADFFTGDYEAVVVAGFVLQIDDPALVTRFGMANPPMSIETYRKHVEMRIEATNYALPIFGRPDPLPHLLGKLAYTSHYRPALQA